MSLYNRNGIWYYHFELDGIRHRGSTRTNNKKKAQRAFSRAFDTAVMASGKPERYLPHRGSVRPEYVYLVRAGAFHKIGIAANVQKRMAGIQGGNPHTVELIGSWLHGDPRSIEQRLHWRFANKRVHGEWFSLDPGDIEQLKLELANFLAGPKSRRGRR